MRGVSWTWGRVGVHPFPNMGSDPRPPRPPLSPFSSDSYSCHPFALVAPPAPVCWQTFSILDGSTTTMLNTRSGSEGTSGLYSISVDLTAYESKEVRLGHMLGFPVKALA